MTAQHERLEQLEQLPVSCGGAPANRAARGRRSMGARLKRAVPSLITLTGLVCGIAGALLLPTWIGIGLLALSQALDVLDGWAARRLGAESTFGAALDLASDSVLAVVIAHACLGPVFAGGVAIVVALLNGATAAEVLPYRTSGRAFVTASAIALAITLGLSGCVVGPDGRRVLSPAARAIGEAMLEQVLRCSARGGLAAAASAAVNGGPPDEQVLLDASRCHIDLAIEQGRRGLEQAPAPTVEHGRLIERARELEDAGEHDQAIEVARECDRQARGGL